MRKLLTYAQETSLSLKDPKFLGREMPGWYLWAEIEEALQGVLAECEANRRIIAAHGPRSTPDGVACAGCGFEERPHQWWPVRYPCGTLRAVALPYADRPGYQERFSQ